VAAVLAALPASERAKQTVYGGPAAVARVREMLPDVRTFDGVRVKRCLVSYEALGWLGRTPDACRDTRVLVPLDQAGLLWGFPRRFSARMTRAGSEVVLVGNVGGGHVGGIDDVDALSRVPTDFGGWIWTDRTEVIGPSAHR
jgi:glycerophosphoryl diester phosphodiesterase